METKFCHACNTEKSVDQFHKNKGRKDGLATQCKACVKAYHKATYLKHKPRHDKARKEWAANNKDRMRQLQKRWVEQNADHLREYRRQYDLENADRIAQRDKQYRENNKEKIYARAKESIKALRSEFFWMYGGHCALCDPANPDAWNPEFLTLDHVNGGGSKERKKRGGMWAYRDAIKDGVPDFTKYRVLCWNHNFALGHPRKPYDELGREGKANRDVRDCVIEGYGGKCSCCGETTREFLQLDHIAGGGCEHLKTDKSAHFKDAKSRNFPPDYQVLCTNCNLSKHFGGGICFHQRDALLNNGAEIQPIERYE